MYFNFLNYFAIFCHNPQLISAQLTCAASTGQVDIILDTDVTCPAGDM